MDRLLTIFAAAGCSAADEDAVGLEKRLAELCARGRAAHPALGVDDEAFVTHLVRCGAGVREVLEELHAEDLYLACACLSGNTDAVARLRDTYRPIVARYLKRIGRSEPLHEEVEQGLWDAVLVGGSDGPKLATYAGRGPLGGFLGISAQRIALMLLRHEKAESRARQEVAAQSRLAGDDPELAAIRERYRAQFQAAVEGALGTLDDRDRTLYRMRLVDELTLEAIAKSYGVRHPTILRWLESARERVLEETKRRLREALPVSSGEFESIARLLVSQLELNISRVMLKKT